MIEWIFSGIGVSLPIFIFTVWFSYRRGQKSVLHVDEFVREETISLYPDPRLKIKRPQSYYKSEYYVLFNLGMLKDDSVHSVRVLFDYFKSKSTPCIARMYETFEKAKDFYVKEHNGVNYIFGEGTVDWSVWITKTNIIEDKKIMYGCMAYYGFHSNVIGSASLLLLEVDKDFWESYQPGYTDVSIFSRKAPNISKIINLRKSKIVADFYDLQQVNAYDLFDDLKKVAR